MARKASRTTPNHLHQPLRGADFVRAHSSVVLGEDVRNQRRGFTIVELLIVVVVIALLAAITIVAYNGINNRAKASAAASAAEQAAKKVMTYAITNAESYPATLSVAGVTDSGSTSYQYRVNNSANPKTFCLTATNNNVSYFVSSSASGAAAGACAGHGANGSGTITNLAINPSVESNLTGYSAANGATITRETAAAIDGTYGIRIVTPTGGSQDSGLSLSSLGGPTSVTVGQVFTYALSIRAVDAGTYRLYLYGSGGSASQSITLGAGEVGRIRYVHTASATGAIAAYVLRTTTTSRTFDVDQVSIHAGDVDAAYADGSSPGWVWNGTQNNSTSTGPAL